VWSSLPLIPLFGDEVCKNVRDPVQPGVTTVYVREAQSTDSRQENHPLNPILFVPLTASERNAIYVTVSLHREAEKKEPFFFCVHFLHSTENDGIFFHIH